MFEKYCGQTTDTTSHTPEKLTPNLLTQLEYSQRTVYVENYVKNVCELASESGSISTSNISSHGRADSTCESCSISEHTDYLLYVKERANIIRTNLRTDKSRHVEMYESEGSSVDSTGGLVNMRQDVTHLNMCDNPGDMWHGLKTLDGKPVVLHPLKGKHGSHKTSAFANNAGKKWPSLTKMLQTIRRKNNATPFDNSVMPRKIVNSGDKIGIGTNGPIDYSGGFLNINRYIKRGKNPTNNSNGTKFKRGNEGKYDFPIPQNIPHSTNHNSPNDSMNSQPRQNMNGKIILHKDRSRTGKSEMPDKIDMRYKQKTKQGRTKQLAMINATNANTNNGPRAHRNKRRKTPRTDLDANA